jgi:hypothetical protein
MQNQNNRHSVLGKTMFRTETIPDMMMSAKPWMPLAPMSPITLPPISMFTKFVKSPTRLKAQ